MIDKAPARTAYVALLGMTIVWGSTFVVMRVGVLAVREAAGPGAEALGPILYLFLRFALAFVAGCAIFRISPASLTRSDWKRGGAMGLIMVGGFVLQIYGLERTTPAVSAFLTSLYVVFTPLLDLVVRRRVPAARVSVGVAVTVAGVFFLTRPWTGTAGLGETLGILCAVLFAGHILLIDALTRGGRDLELTLTTIGSAAVLLALPLPFLPGAGRLAAGDFWLSAFGDPWMSLGLPFLSVVATVGAIGIINRFQKALHPTRAAILYTLEPVWALLLSGALGGEALGAAMLAGAGLIVAGNLWSEVGPATLRRTAARPGVT